MTGAAEGFILAIDTSTRASLVAVGREKPEAISRREVRHRHGSHVLDQIDEVLERAGVSIADVTALATGTGPGSFTGLRVGMATAKTIAYARGLPLVGVMSSDALRRAILILGHSPCPEALEALEEYGRSERPLAGIARLAHSECIALASGPLELADLPSA